MAVDTRPDTSNKQTKRKSPNTILKIAAANSCQIAPIVPKENRNARAPTIQPGIRPPDMGIGDTSVRSSRDNQQLLPSGLMQKPPSTALSLLARAAGVVNHVGCIFLNGPTPAMLDWTSAAQNSRLPGILSVRC